MLVEQWGAAHKARQPNWGHPVLRGVKNQRVWPTLEAARAELILLHEEFPETSIPGADKLHLMVYTRQAKPPIAKITLTIEAQGDQGFIIVPSEQRKASPSITKPSAAEGKFTTMVLQRKRRK